MHVTGNYKIKIMSTENVILVYAYMEHPTVSVTVMGIVNNGMIPQGDAMPDSNSSERVMNTENTCGKMRVRSPACDTKFPERLPKTATGHPQSSGSRLTFIVIGVFLETLGNS